MLPVPDSQKSDFTLGLTVVPCLHDIGMSFCTGMRNLTPVRAVTGVNSHQFVDSLWYEMLCWYHVNEYRATKGNQSEHMYRNQPHTQSPQALWPAVAARRDSGEFEKI